MLDTEEPETVPCRAEESTATFAGPPDAQPARELARSIKNWPKPVFSRKAPKRMNRKMKVEQTPSGLPMTPSVVMNRWVMMRLSEKPRCCRKLGRYLPT